MKQPPTKGALCSDGCSGLQAAATRLLLSDVSPGQLETAACRSERKPRNCQVRWSFLLRERLTMERVRLRIRVVHAVVLLGWLIGALVSMALVPGTASAADRASPLVLHLKWRRVAAGPNLVSTSDRYVAIQTCPGSPSSCTPRLSVLDEQTGHQRVVAVPSSCGKSFGSDGFGGPYLAVGCTGASLWLYDLTNSQSVPVAAKCPADCSFVGVGSSWLKFDSNRPWMHRALRQHLLLAKPPNRPGQARPSRGRRQNAG